MSYLQEVICNAQAEESRALKASCEADLAEALPALESAVSALKSLSKGDIVEASSVVFVVVVCLAITQSIQLRQQGVLAQPQCSSCTLIIPFCFSVALGAGQGNEEAPSCRQTCHGGCLYYDGSQTR